MKRPVIRNIIRSPKLQALLGTAATLVTTIVVAAQNIPKKPTASGE